MSSWNLPTRLFVGALLVSVFAACSPDESNVGCSSDDDCTRGLYCDTEINKCLCNTDDACVLAKGEGYQCNNFGICQPRPPCLGNQDCVEGEICNSADASGGICVPVGTCGSTIHCAFDEYCNSDTGECLPGCRNSGDCQLGKICIDGNCAEGGCNSCPSTPDPDASYCDYGDLCRENGSCTPHSAKSSLCDQCGADPNNIFGGSTNCGAAMICLVDELGTGNYCAPTCETDLDCPNGYSGCGGITIVTTECRIDGDCSNGGVCLRPPEGNTGFCSCVSNMDCPAQDMCLGGQCMLLQGMSCQTDQDCWSSCVQSETGSGTSIGVCETNIKGCGKNEGVSCAELQPGNAPCNDF